MDWKLQRDLLFSYCLIFSLSLSLSLSQTVSLLQCSALTLVGFIFIFPEVESEPVFVGNGETF